MERFPELFRTARLNVVGWAAVAGLCAAGAGAGLAASRVIGVAVWVGVAAGGAAAPAVLIAADRRKWGAMSTTYSWTDDLDATRQVADLLARAGIPVSVEVDEFGGPLLRYFHCDLRRIRRVWCGAGRSHPPPG